MKHNVEVFKLVPKVLDLCYDETVPQQMKKLAEPTIHKPITTTLLLILEPVR